MSAACLAAQARLPPCRPPQQGAAVRQQQQQRQQRAARPGQRSPAGRCPLPPLRAAQWQPPPGLAILPWTGDAEQVSALQKLQQRMAAGPFPAAAQDEATLRWFLQDRKMDVEGAEEKLLTMLRWRTEFG
jgi:hypothetical protein